jgi:hypothetical protein
MGSAEDTAPSGFVPYEAGANGEITLNMEYDDDYEAQTMLRLKHVAAQRRAMAEAKSA